MKYFPNGEEEIELIKFVAEYQYLNVNDEKYFFKSKKYYKERVNELIKKKYLRRVKLNLVLGEMGIEYIQVMGYKYNKINTNPKYKERLLRLSHIGAFYYETQKVKFTPSFAIKNKQIYTLTGRRYIGILEISGIDYLTYPITEKHDKKYIASVLDEIQKECKYGNFIFLVDDVNRVNKNDFACGHYNALLIENNDENLEKLKHINSIRWSDIINDYYKADVVLSEYYFCDYTNHKDKFIVTLNYFWNIEKILQYYSDENEKKRNILKKLTA